MSDMIMSSHEREAMAKMQVMERRLVDREAIVASLPVRDEAVDVGGDGKFRSVKKVIKPSTERFVLPGERVTVRYTGWVVPTAVVEEAVRRKFEPPFDTSPGFSFTLGAMDVISGWEMGVGTMRIGERAYLVLAPEHAYGSAGAGSTIPPNATSSAASSPSSSSSTTASSTTRNSPKI
ncbi:hypothetical protein CTAYLR_003171 [Chrysophaeum taylorii]|uniref:peptidylprolyl isomerase n=1 Tax=Chrysophaeum taylorii TaxID=2483200 RepID=A0AAD7XHI9_9STRA|nr:hypothetical protein CTAYLR_003171 [Chrysophaeum taylorii]